MKEEVEKIKKIAILRGINVGGKRRLLMSDLREMLGDIGLQSIETYIQSGNVIFESKESTSELQTKIQDEIEKRFGYEVPVIVRTAKELKDSVSGNPFLDKGADINKLHLTFLKEVPSKAERLELESNRYEPDQFAIIGRDIFIQCEGKYHKSKLTNGFFEKHLNTGATTRNWKTVMKLVNLAHGK